MHTHLAQHPTSVRTVKCTNTEPKNRYHLGGEWNKSGTNIQYELAIGCSISLRWHCQILLGTHCVICNVVSH